MTFPPTVTEPLLACCSGLNCSGFAESGLLDVSSLACAIVRIGNAAKEVISTTTHKASLPIGYLPFTKLSENLILLAELGLGLFQCVGADLCALRILRGSAAGQRNGANNFALYHDGNTSLQRRRAFQAQIPEPIATLGNLILKPFRWPLEKRRRTRLADGKLGAPDLRVVDLLVINKSAVGIDHGEGHCPIILSRFRDRSCGSLLGVFERDRWPVRIRHLLRFYAGGAEKDRQHSSEFQNGSRGHDFFPPGLLRFAIVYAARCYPHRGKGSGDYTRI